MSKWQIAWRNAAETLKWERQFRYGWKFWLPWFQFPINVVYNRFTLQWPVRKKGMYGQTFLLGVIWVFSAVWMFLPLWLPSVLAIRYVATHLTLGWK